MSEVVGLIATSHVPAIGGAIAKGLKQDPYWKPFFDGFPAIHAWLAEKKPDLVVVVYNDHGPNFFLDKMPTFAIQHRRRLGHSHHPAGRRRRQAVLGGDRRGGRR